MTATEVLTERAFEVVRSDCRKNPNADICLPRRSTAHSAGYDFTSPQDLVLGPGKVTILWTDVKAKMPEGEVLLVFVRSSMGRKLISMANGTGIIDADYFGNPDNDGNIGLMLLNNGEEPYAIHSGDRVAQGIFVKYETVTDDPIEKDTDCSESQKKRTGGLGSTGQ